MLRITIELLPYGSEAHKKHLGTMEIANDGTGGLSTGNYNVRLSKRGQPKTLWKVGRVLGFPRKRLGAYDLMLRALAACIGSRNPDAAKEAHLSEEELTAL